MAIASATDAAAEPPRRKVALITGAKRSEGFGSGAAGALTRARAGINGQDGSYLAELLLTKGYAVVGARCSPARAPGSSCLPQLLTSQTRVPGLRARRAPPRLAAAADRALSAVAARCAHARPANRLGRAAAACGSCFPLSTAASDASRSPGIKRRASSFNQPRLDAILATHPRAKNLTLHYGAPPSRPLPRLCDAAAREASSPASGACSARPRTHAPAGAAAVDAQLLTWREARCCAGDVSDSSALAMLMRETKPDEVYNLAAQSHVAVSFIMPKCVRAVGAAPDGGQLAPRLGGAAEAAPPARAGTRLRWTRWAR